MSIIGGDIERTLLSHYNIPSLYPDEWPEEKNDAEDVSDDEEDKKKKAAKARRTKRYTTLERGRGQKNRVSVPGSQKGKDGVETLVQTDEPDPLGASASVVSVLRQRGLPVDNDVKLRNRFLMSSTSFSPALFLSQVHSRASTDQLLRGLDTLSASIEKKSASLKVLVESNFERFVRAKATIDNVYTEMRNHGADVETGLSHSRKTSRQSNHFRTPSNQQNLRLTDNPKRKNALVKESEYGTVGVKAPLTEATSKAEEVWGPALGGREREEYLKAIVVALEQNKSIIEVGAAIEDSIKRRDYETLAEEYSRAQRYRKEALNLAMRAKENDAKISDPHIHQILITGRVMVDINRRVDDFKRETWRKLTSVNLNPSSNTPDGKQEEYIELISVLLKLGTDENPIWVWLQSRYEHLRVRITNAFERMRVDLEIQRRKLATGSRTTSVVLARHLKSALKSRQKGDTEDMDTRQVMQFWEREMVSLTSLLSGKTGLLGEVVEYWETAQSFIEGVKQRGLPAGIDGQSRKHHRLEQKEGEELKQGAIEIFGLFREQLHGLFVEAPVEDVSTMFSPASPTPKTPMTSMFSPGKIARFTFDAKDVPPISPTKGESWEKYAFWPPHSNALSAVTFLNRINNMIGIAACEMASVNIVKKEARLTHHLRNLVVDVREKSIGAVVAAWIVDAENCRELEDWTRSPEKPDVTNLPTRFSAFETSMLSNLQRIVYIPDAANHTGSAEIILPPPPRHVEAVQKGFKNSMYRSFSGMMEHASKPAHGQENARGDMDLTLPLTRDEGLSANGDSIDSSNSNVRKLLTISNFQALRNDVVPSLVSTFESSFLLTITDDAKVARDALSQLHARVFQSYVRPTVESLRLIVTNGIMSPTYAPDTTRPSDARPYVYDVLLRLVFIHTEVSRTAPALTGQVLSYLLEQLSVALIDAFKKRPRYSLSALMQATLDVEFLAQTLDNYTTKKAGEVQGEIYQALDERTDNDARQRLQNGLPEMKAILKRLRDKTKGEFGCFKRARKSKGDREKERDKERERERERESAY